MKFRCVAGRAGYNLARSEHVPLPSITKLYSTFQWIHVGVGIIKPVIEYLRMKSSTTWSKTEKLTHIVFDEMKISDLADIDRILDKLLGPADQAQFVMARGLVYDWKWPVLVHFDYQIKKLELMQIIIALEAEAGLEVLSACCDQG